MKSVFKYYKHSNFKGRIVLFIFIVTGLSVNGQYFSRDYGLFSGLTNGYINSIQVADDTIYAMCGIIDTAPPYYPIALFDKFDKYGNLLSQSVFNIPNRTNIGVNYNNLIRTNDGGFAFGGNTVGMTINQNAILLIKYDRHGNLQWYKEYPDTNCVEFYCNALLQDSFSNYYLSGSIDDSLYNSIDYIAKTDSLGNLIMIRNFVDSNFSNNTWGESINKKGHIVMGGGYGNNSSNLTQLNGGYEIYELDTGLNLLNHIMGRDTTILWGISAGNIHQASDGGYICGNGTNCYIDTAMLESLGSVSKLDSNFNVVWTINVGPCSFSIYSTTFKSLSPSPDGNWIAVGQWYDNTDTPQIHVDGWIMKFTEAGQVIWSKLYRGVTSDGVNGDNNGLYTIGFLSDSSMIFGGMAWDEDSTAPPPQQGWLLHLDTAGCLPDSNSCGVSDGIRNLPTAVGYIRAYPNPASEQMRFDVALDQPSDYVLHITDLLGQTISQTSQSGPSAVIDVSRWPAGLYVYKLSSVSGFEASGKFVVSH